MPIIIFPQNISDEMSFSITLDWPAINICKSLLLTTEIYRVDLWGWSTRYISVVSQKLQLFCFPPRTMKEYIYSQKEMFYVNWNKSGLTPRQVLYTIKLFKILDLILVFQIFVENASKTKLIRSNSSKSSTFSLLNLCHLLFNRSTKDVVQSINYGLSDHFKKYM